ncbi:MAG: hypothetical protein RLY95_1850 [Pseudomonadota bacterium]|jgi:hypothetical protein
METPSELLARWANSKCKNISVGGLLARCPIAHKWKSPYRSLVIRETLFWRMHDLGQQAHLLFSNGHLLGARILLRSALETLGILIYLNQRTNAVISGSFSFFEFSRLTMHLMLGSRNNSTSHPAINILTILQKAEKSHSGLVSLHERLSESAHPNFDGVLYTYSARIQRSTRQIFQIVGNNSLAKSRRPQCFLCLRCSRPNTTRCGQI